MLLEYPIFVYNIFLFQAFHRMPNILLTVKKHKRTIAQQLAYTKINHNSLPSSNEIDTQISFNKC